MSDHDLTFTRSQFKEILNKYDMIQNLYIKDDHHALGLIESFARTSKKTLTRIFLSNGNSNWIKHLDEIIDNFNKCLIVQLIILLLTMHFKNKTRDQYTIFIMKNL